jgi:hypothetical protein
MFEILTTVVVAAVWIALAAAFMAQRDALERRYLWASLFAHQAAAIAMVLVTNYYYSGGDMTNYYLTGRFIAARLRADFFDVAPALVNVILQREQMLPFPGTIMGSNTGSLQALSGLLVYLFQDSLYAVCMAIAGANFVAKVALLDIFKYELPDVPRTKLYFACLLVPSTVFWSSGLLKEPIAMLGLCAMISGAHLMGAKAEYRRGGLRLMIGTLVTGLFKGYLVPVFGVAAGMWLLARTVQRRFGRAVIRTRFVVAAVALVVVTFVITGWALPQFAPETFAEQARNEQETAANVQGGSNYSLGERSVGAQLPLAVATALFRPAIFEANPVIIAVTATEMLWFTLTFGLVFLSRPVVSTLRLVMSTPALAFSFGFVITLSVGVGLTTTNLGTLSRYRMPLMPFYAILLVVLSWRGFGRQVSRQSAAPMLPAAERARVSA